MGHGHARLALAGAVFLLYGCLSAAPASDASVGDAGSGDADATLADDAADAGSSYGQPCAVADGGACPPGLFCLQGPNGGATGFCTATCPASSSAQCDGTPPGTAAFCVVTGVDPQGDKGCAFFCKSDKSGMTWPCPGALKCQTIADPPDSGDYLCLP